MTVIFHVLSRGVDKRKIFLDDKDRFRFIHDLFEFNDEALANTAAYHFYHKNKFDNSGDIVSRQNRKIKEREERKPRKLLVNILAFCIMPNHYHLMLESKKEKGIPLFMKKLNIGYAKYFNQKYKRVGTLFEGRYKSVQVLEQAHFIHLPYYIHLNPLDLVTPEWRERKLSKSNYDKANNFLRSYRWSSHLDYCGIKNFPSVTQREFLLDFFEGETKYQKTVMGWLKNIESVMSDMDHNTALE